MYYYSQPLYTYDKNTENQPPMKNYFIFIILFFIPFNTNGYNLYTTSVGDYVRWKGTEVEVTLDFSLEMIGPRDDVEEVLWRSFELWEDAGELPLVFDLVWGECSVLQETGHNCISACADRAKCYGGESDNGATTDLEVETSDGTIVRGEIVFNADDWNWMLEQEFAERTEGSEEITSGLASQTDQLSLGRVAVHEIGHFIGIDHSSDPDSVMYPSISPDQKSVSWLQNDDIAAATFLYHGIIIEELSDFNEKEGDRDIDVSACLSNAVGRPPKGSLGPLLLMVMVVWVLVRSRAGL